MGRDICYFDSECGLCRRSVRLLRKLDWLNRLDFQDLATAVEVLRISPEQALRGMPLKTAHGQILIGFKALRRALLQTPLGFVPACLAHIPLVSHLGSALYTFIAARRGRDPLCRLTDPN